MKKMTSIFKENLENMNYFQPQNYKNMTVIGLQTKQKHDIDLLTLSKGLSMGLVEINEVDDNAVVSQIQITNKAVTPLLILDGEEIIGSKQNRIINNTIIIPAKTTQTIDVSCTEAGRWHYTSKFKYSKHMATSHIRKNKQESITQSLTDINSYKSDQAEVWDNINKLELKLHVESKTSALKDTYQSNKKQVKQYLDAFKYENNQNGIIIIINNNIVGMEILYNHEKYIEYHEEILESYIIDAIATKDKNSTQTKCTKEDFIENIINAETEKFENQSLGEDYRINNNEITGSIRTYENNLINASLFNKTSEEIASIHI